MEAYLTMCPYCSETMRNASLHIGAELTGRKWVKSAFEVMEVSRFWRKIGVNYVTEGRKDESPNLYEKVARVN